MWRKTVVRRICKYLPLSPELKRQIEHEDKIEETSTIDLVAEAASTLGATESPTKSLADRIKGDDKASASESSDPKTPHDAKTGEVADKEIKSAGPSADDNDAQEPSEK
jgi:recombinational DNA repair protein RecT